MPLVESCFCRVYKAGYDILGVINRKTIDNQINLAIIVFPCFKVFVYTLKVALYIYAGVALKLVCFELLFYSAALVKMDRCHNHKSSSF